MERTMDVVGEMAYRAGSDPRAPLPPHGRIFEEERRVGNSLLGSMEAGLAGRAAFSPLEEISEDENVGGCALAAYEEVERMYDLSTIPRMTNTRHPLLSGRPGSLGNQNVRQRSNTDPQRNQISNQVTRPARPGMGPKPSPLDSGCDSSLPLNKISMFIDAETIGMLMVAAGKRTLDSSRQYTTFPDNQEGHFAREAAPYRKDLDRWLGADAESLPDIINQPACTRGVVLQGEKKPQRQLPSVTHTDMKLAGVRLTRKASSSFERFMHLKGISAAEEKIVGEKMGPASGKTGHRPAKLVPPITQANDFAGEDAARLLMLQRRRQDVDKPKSRKSRVEYPNEEELKAIQRDIRSRTVQRWIREERRGTWYGYGLGV